MLNSKKKENHYINGHWVQGQGSRFVSTNPADGSIVWEGTSASSAEVFAANEAARNALPFWSALDFAGRANYLQLFASIVDSKRQQLAYLIALETGKPLWEANTEVNSVVGKIKLSIEAYQERNAEKITKTADATACLRYKPQGVAAVLGAFNFPAHLANSHIAPALLAGNTIIYKPSEFTPAVAEFIIQCWEESGIPPGVINCLQGDANCGQALLSSDIQAVYFTGSYQTGKKIHQQFSDKPEVILALEMGGNNPLVIDEVADISAAVYQSILSTMITAGQRCTCARRLFIPYSSTGEAFLKKFTKACQNLIIGRFNDQPEPFMGPVISYNHAKAHLESQQKLIQAGGQPLLLMSSLAENTGFLSPGIIEMTEAKPVADEEIFAPLVQVFRYKIFEEAIDLANNSRYGLAAGLISDNQQHFEHFYKSIRAGLINWNRATTGASSSLPFGGVGRSGNHRPSAYFAADYCSYPIASLVQPHLTKPAHLLPGIVLE